MGIFLSQLVGTVVTILVLAIIIRSLLSFAPIDRSHPIVQLLFQFTEPFLRPIRNIMPSAGMFDFSPLIAILVLNVIRFVLGSLLITLFP